MIAAPPLELQELDQVALIAILLGLRQGEVLGVAWRDVDLDQRVLAVRETLQYRPGDGFHLVPPKNSKITADRSAPQYGGRSLEVAA
jgi:integrase